MNTQSILIASMKFSEKLIELQQTQDQINDHVSFSLLLVLSLLLMLVRQVVFE